MSAFIVSDNTMQRVVQACVYYSQNPCIVQLKAPGKSREDYSQLGYFLYAMNTDAINHRNHRNQRKEKSPCFLFKGSTIEADRNSLESCEIAQFLKSIHCLLYQCSEGEVPESTLYRALEELEERIRSCYATSTEDYRSAAWD